MDVDAFVAARQADWARLGELAGRRQRLSGGEVDELVALYQRTATHLSMVRSASPDPALVARLSALVARARAAVTGASVPAWDQVARFFAVSFPVAVLRAWRWWVPAAAGSLLVAALVGWWVATHPEVQAAIAAPEEIRTLTRPGGAFERYYSENPASAFAARVWTNNAWIAAQSLVFGALLGLPALYLLAVNAVNIGVAGGLMAAAGRLDVFFGLILPHGLLELTAVFIAAGTGLRLGWTVVDPGPDRRGTALAREGRAAVTLALGLAVVLLLSGVVEAFVTPSGWPTAARVTVGAVAAAGFLGYVLVCGRRARRAGETGDLAAEETGDQRPTAG